MAKARFFIKDNVQDVGYRLFIIQKILNSDLEGTALNLLDRRIEVRLKGKREKILKFIEELKTELPELAKNPKLVGIEFNENLVVPDAMRSSQALIAEQLGKGVVFIKEGFDNLPHRIADALKDR